MQISLASFKSRLVVPFWYQLTQVILEKRPLNEYSSSVVRDSEWQWHELGNMQTICISLQTDNNRNSSPD